MPVPYLGSKRDSAGKIYQTIKNLSPDANVLVDLFCGGLAISEYFLKNGWKVIANDKNKYVIALIGKTVFDGLPKEEVEKFITRDKFNDVLENRQNYEDWYVGYVMCVWSFGNNQRNYLFGKDTEKYKRAGHELVIDKNPDLIKKLIPNILQKYIDGILKQDTWHKRRIALGKVSDRLKTKVFELQQLEQLQRLERLERLELYSYDYKNIKIPDGAVVYCDPPYQGKAEYEEGGFNHNDFWQWVRDTSQKNDVYVSEYSAPEEFKKVLEFSRNSTLASGQNVNSPNECLFKINKKFVNKLQINTNG